MIKKEIQALQNQINTLRQQTMAVPRPVRIKEYFPNENKVTIEFTGIANRNTATPKNDIGDFKFPLGHRGDISESLAPQKGDLGLLMYSGTQYKRGYVLLSHSEGGDDAMTYVPIRGVWGV